jgi:hypothetical protein
MNESVSKYIKGCAMCATSKPNNIKLGLYTPLPVPSQSWESIFMDLVGGFPMSRKGHDYLFVVVDRFNKMCILMPCKKRVIVGHTTKMFFANVWVHFRLPTSIISDRDSCFLGKFWSHLWELIDTKLKKSTNFHPQTDGQTTVVNKTIVHLFRGYYNKHPELWDEQLPYIQHAYNHSMHSSTQKTPFEVCLGHLLNHLWNLFLEKQVNKMDRMIQIKLKSSFKRFNRYIKEYMNNWRRAKASIRQDMINIGLTISLKSVIKYGYISTRIE